MYQKQTFPKRQLRQTRHAQLTKYKTPNYTGHNHCHCYSRQRKHSYLFYQICTQLFGWLGCQRFHRPFTYDAGWRCSDENFEWSTDVADQNTKGTYRDDLNVGRVFIHPQNEAIFSYPIAYLKAGQVYTFSCSSSKMSGKENRPPHLLSVQKQMVQVQS